MYFQKFINERCDFSRDTTHGLRLRVSIPLTNTYMHMYFYMYERILSAHRFMTAVIVD